MLIGVDKAEDIRESIPFQRPMAVALGAGLFVLVLIAGRAAWVTGTRSLAEDGALGTIENVADELFGVWLLPFEATVLLLTIAAVGTIALAQFVDTPRELAAAREAEISSEDEDGEVAE